MLYESMLMISIDEHAHVIRQDTTASHRTTSGSRKRELVKARPGRDARSKPCKAVHHVVCHAERSRADSAVRYCGGGTGRRPQHAPT